ncbi:MAG: hypothetical protein SNG38_07665 [Rikenellaceae bacterium]
MEQELKKEKSQNLVISTLLVAILALSSVALMLFAFVIWFAEVIHSLTLSLCITSIVLAIGAWVTYKITLSPTLKQLKEEYDRAMTIISLVKHGYDCATKRLSQFLSLFS